MSLMDAAETPPAAPSSHRVTLTFIDAVAARDLVALHRLLAPGAGMRAVTPLKVIEEAGADAIVARFDAWFGDQDHVELVNARTRGIGAREGVTYELRTSDVEGSYQVAQHAFIDIRGDRIHRIDLLCSGFQHAQGVA
ncbi:MAG TPA: hypothetical protein VM370_01120 [Candidatus Thermoplasmatota archaeon]|nr:hypothetical protein [Candidatus Thermoplasmatota archaeon]